jgi:hypothetical protein
MENIEGLRQEWLKENLASCATLAAKLAVERQPAFAAAALAACLVAVNGPEQLYDVVRIGEEPGRWSQAHLAFDTVRVLTLQSERCNATSQDPAYMLLFVAENSARVIYNASSPPDPFDEDSAAWLLLVLAQLVRCTQSSSLEESIWQGYRNACCK